MCAAYHHLKSVPFSNTSSREIHPQLYGVPCVERLCRLLYQRGLLGQRFRDVNRDPSFRYMYMLPGCFWISIIKSCMRTSQGQKIFRTYPEMRFQTASSTALGARVSDDDLSTFNASSTAIHPSPSVSMNSSMPSLSCPDGLIADFVLVDGGDEYDNGIR